MQYCSEVIYYDLKIIIQKNTNYEYYTKPTKVSIVATFLGVQMFLFP
jgi:hypothetical protein